MNRFVENINKNLKNIYTALSSLLLSIGISGILFDFWGFDISLNIVLFFSCFIILFLSLADYSQNKIVFWLSIFLFILCIIVLGYFLRSKLSGFLKDSFEWFKLYMYNMNEYQEEYAKFIGVFFIVIISLMSYGLNHYLIAKTLISLGLIAAGFASVFLNIELKNISCLGMVFYIFYTFLELYNIFDIKNKTHSAAISKYLFPVCFITALLTVSLPSDKEPVKWTWAKNIYYSVTDTVELLLVNIQNSMNNSNLEFKINMSGYSEDTSLGGIIIKSSKPMMYVKVLDKPKHSLYLTGSVKNKYTSQQWIFTDNAEYEIDEYLIDTYEFLYGMYNEQLDRRSRERLLSTKKISIEYGKINTITCFYPLKTYLFDTGSRNNIDTKGPNILYDKMKNSKNNYELEFLDYNVDGRILRGLNDFEYNLNSEISLEEYKSFVRYYTGLEVPFSNSRDLLNLFYERSRNIKQVYSEVPQSISQEVKNLVYSITEQYESNYDKLKAIEKYLNSYKYTLFPTPTPADRDFIEYFLLEQKEGYCTYFASAMTIMSRIIGMPARYVQGIMVDYSSQNEKFLYTVEDSAAHAWTEVYFEGIGWIAFEPTPSCYDNRYNSWEKMVSDINYKEKIKEEKNSYYEEIEDEEITEEYNDIDYSDLEVPEKEEDNTINKYFAVIVLSMVISLILLPLIYYRFARYKYLKKFKQADINEKIYLEFIEILYLMEKRNIKLQKNETLSEFSKRISEIKIIEGMDFKRIADIYMKARYYKVYDEEEFKIIQLYKQRLSTKIYSKSSKLKIFLTDFIFYIKISDYAQKY